MKRFFEQVLVDPVADGIYRVVATPGLVLGIAAGDIIRVTPEAGYEIDGVTPLGWWT